MASLSSTYALKHRHWPSPWLSSLNSHFVASRRFLQPLSSPFPCSFICPRKRQRSFVGFTSYPLRQIPFRAQSSDSTSSSPPPSDPPPSNDESISGALSRVQDTVQIFCAVLLWMALFFWASAWDGRNGGKLNRGNQFKR